jgi:putative glutamine amidotransferase
VTGESVPLIGVTGRRATFGQLGGPPGWADAPADWYVAAYARGVMAAGGLPVHLPGDADPARLAERLDGLLLVGGPDIHPSRYDQVPGEHNTDYDQQRDQFEIDLFQAGLAQGLPMLGVCRGHQLINVALGGSLIQHLTAALGPDHQGAAAYRTDRTHRVRLEPGSRLAGLLGQEVAVNSFHHQAVDRLGRGLVVAGWAEDGVIEAIELPGQPVVGVQWHPEAFGADPVFEWLVAAASANARL